MRRWTAVMVIGLLLACSRPRPSPEYEQARQLWTELVRTHPDAPAQQPRADEVLALLDRVPRDSLDATAAASLRERIENERRESAAERTRRTEMEQRAGTPSPPVMMTPGAPEASGGAAPPGGRTEELTSGMKVDDFRARFGSCFDEAGPVQLLAADAGPRSGEMWVMKADERCREAHPQLAGQAVLFSGGTLAGVSPVSALKRVEVRKDVELAPLPDGGTGMVVDGGVVPLPAGARLITADGGSTQ